MQVILKATYILSDRAGSGIKIRQVSWIPSLKISSITLSETTPGIAVTAPPKI